MNRYRITGEYDEHTECQCLKCMGKFSYGRVFDNWKYCPMCGTLWDGLFAIRHKKYPIPNNYDWQNPGYSIKPGTNEIDRSDEPRLVIEYGVIENKKLHDMWFAVVDCEPKLVWCTITHCKLGEYLYENASGSSSSVWMMKTYNEYSKKRPILRLKLVTKNSCKVIKQQGL